MSGAGNPVIGPAAMGLVLAIVLVVLGVWLMRRVRKSITADLENSTRPSDDPAFGVAAYSAVIQRLKEQEQELKRLRQAESDRAAATENVSAAVLSNLSSGVLLFNPAGLVQQVNDAAKGILGYASPLGLHARDVFRGLTAARKETGEALTPEALVQAVETAVREGQSFRRIAAEYATPRGEQRVLGITISPVRGAAGQSLGAACLVSDLTEITKLEREVRLRESLAALGEMSAGIAHEFKNGLATVSGYAQMLTAETEGEARQFAGKIAGEAASLTHTVTDFLTFARPQPLRREPVSLRPVLEDCARDCGIELRADGVGEEIAVRGDGMALRQVFTNLFRNSAEAARDHAAVQVEVSAWDRGTNLEIALRDNGGGIAKEDLSRVFIPFFTTKAQGTGLGLALVHRIVTEHGGAIAVVSDGSGTTFTLLLPLAREAKKAGQTG